MAIDCRLHFSQPQAVVVLAFLHVSLVTGLILYRHGASAPIHVENSWSSEVGVGFEDSDGTSPWHSESTSV